MRPSWKKDHATAVPQLIRALAANTSRLCVLVALSGFVTSLLWATASQDVRGVVKDRSGAVVARAQVTLRIAGQNFDAATQPDGTFVFSDVTAETATIQVTAPGFATTAVNWRATEGPLTIARAGHGAAEPGCHRDANVDPSHRRR